MLESFLSDHMLGIATTILVILGFAVLTTDITYLILGAISYIALSIPSVIRYARNQ
jgi:ABC-type Fe3+-siderophore transport system permease subunit